MASHKISISMPRELWNRARAQMAALGISSISAYIQLLVHNDTARRAGLEPREREPLLRVAEHDPDTKVLERPPRLSSKPEPKIHPRKRSRSIYGRKKKPKAQASSPQ